jgi:cytochrome c peroxidase
MTPPAVSVTARRRRRRRAALGFVAGLAAVAAGARWLSHAGRTPASPSTSVTAATAGGWSDLERRRILTFTPMGPAPADPTNRFADDPAAAAFGQQLFFDEGFARGPALSCATCHDPDRWFVDGAPIAFGADLGVRNTQTVLDAAHQRWLFWDGRADSLWSQAIEPFEDVKEYASSRLHVVRRVATEPELRAAFESAIGPLPPAAAFEGLPEDASPRPPRGHAHREAWEQLDPDLRAAIDDAFVGLGKALAAYQRLLITGPGPFDRFVADLRAGGDGGGHLAPDAVRGLRLFIGRADCRACHLGPRFSDGAFHATGVPTIRPGLERDAGRFDGLPLAQADPFSVLGVHSDDPDGPRAAIVRSSIRFPEDYAAFRTPGLRNVAETGPYMHAGQFETLEEVVRFYSTLEGAERFDHHGQSVLQRLDLSEAEIADLVAFLEALTGTPPPAELRRPPAG